MMEDAGIILIAVAIALMLVPPIHITIARPRPWMVTDLAWHQPAARPCTEPDPEKPRRRADAAIARSIPSGARANPLEPE
jgi:hypothetical protein